MINSRTIAQRALQQKMLGIVRNAPICMVTVVDQTGRLVSQPMTPQQVTDEGDVWFVVDVSSEQVRQVASRPYVNLAFWQGSTWLSASGRGHVVHDAAKVHRLWNSYADARFPDGPDDARLGLLRVPMGVERWDGAAVSADRGTSRPARSVAALGRPRGDGRARREVRARAWCALRARTGLSASSCHPPRGRRRRARG